MTTSDFLILISIGVAVITMCETNNKKIWRYKFSRYSMLLVALWLCMILYLTNYSSFRLRGWYLPLFECSNGFSSSTWAFILSMGLLAYVVYKVVLQKTFPKSRHDELISYYRGLLYSDFNLLLSYLDYYHNPNSLPHLLRAAYILKRKKDISGKLQHRIRTEIVYDYYFIDNIVSISPSIFLEHTTSVYSTHDDDAITANEYFSSCLVKNYNQRWYDAVFFAYNKCNEEESCKVIDIVGKNQILDNLFMDRYYYTHIHIMHVFQDAAMDEISKDNSEANNVLGYKSYLTFRKSKLMQYLMFYVITFEHIFDSIHKLGGKVKTAATDNIKQMILYNPAQIFKYALQKQKTDKIDTFLTGEIEGRVFDLVFYCEKHNYTDMAIYAISLWLQVFHGDNDSDSTREDIDRLFELITDGRKLWNNCFSAIWKLTIALIEKQNKQILS